MKESVTKETKTRSGIPMSEDSFKEWEQSFKDIEENINHLYGKKGAAG